MVPEIVMPLHELPRLPNGKINRRGLPEPDFSNRDQSDFVEPKGEAEKRIQEIWQEVRLARCACCQWAHEFCQSIWEKMGQKPDSTCSGKAEVS